MDLGDLLTKMNNNPRNNQPRSSPADQHCGLSYLVSRDYQVKPFSSAYAFLQLPVLSCLTDAISSPLRTINQATNHRDDET